MTETARREFVMDLEPPDDPEFARPRPKPPKEDPVRKAKQCKGCGQVTGHNAVCRYRNTGRRDKPAKKARAARVVRPRKVAKADTVGNSVSTEDVARARQLALERIDMDLADARAEVRALERLRGGLTA